MSTVKRNCLLALIASFFQASLWIIESIGLHLPNSIHFFYPAIVSFGLVYFQSRLKLVPLGIFVAVSYGALLLLSRVSFWYLSSGAVFAALMLGTLLGGFFGFCVGAIVQKKTKTKPSTSVGPAE